MSSNKPPGPGNPLPIPVFCQGMGNVIDDEDALRRRAYEIWEAEGRPEGRAGEHWARAKQDLCEEAGLCLGIQPLPRKHVQPRPLD